MAGSKIFLEPILADTVGGIQGAVDDVVTVLDPVPEKIDEQILMLSKVANVIGSSVNNIAVTGGEEFSFILLNLPAYQELDALKSTGEPDTLVVDQDYSATFNTYVNGTFELMFPEMRAEYGFITNTLTGKEEITIDYSLSRNGSVVKSGTLYSIEKPNGSTSYPTGSDTIDPVVVSGITCAANDEFTLVVTLTVSSYGGEGYMARAKLTFYAINPRNVNAGYKLVDIVDRGIIVQE